MELTPTNKKNFYQRYFHGINPANITITFVRVISMELTPTNITITFVRVISMELTPTTKKDFLSELFPWN